MYIAETQTKLTWKNNADQKTGLHYGHVSS